MTVLHGHAMLCNTQVADCGLVVTAALGCVVPQLQPGVCGEAHRQHREGQSRWWLANQSYRKGMDAFQAL